MGMRGSDPPCLMPRASYLHFVFAEIVRSELLEELALLLVVVLGLFRRDRLRLVEHFLGDEDRGFGAEGESDGVAGAGIELEGAVHAAACDVDADLREERGVAEIVDD